jgi:hypothetical protein
MPHFQTYENEIIGDKAVLRRNSQRISNGFLYLTNVRLVYEANPPLSSKSEISIPLGEITEAHGSSPLFGLRSARFLSVRYTIGGDDDYAEFIISKPEEWSSAIRKWTTPSLAHRDSIDRRVDDDMIRRAENRNRADLTLSSDFFQSLPETGRKDLNRKEKSSMEMRCGKCGCKVMEESNF